MKFTAILFQVPVKRWNFKVQVEFSFLIWLPRSPLVVSSSIIENMIGPVQAFFRYQDWSKQQQQQKILSE